MVWIYEQQRAFHRELTLALRHLTSGGGTAAATALIAASFAYGVFHAAGPGHGKAVLTSYLLTHKQQAARGVGLAAAGALCQGLTAIVLVGGLVGLAGWLPRETTTAVVWSERFSYALVFVVGSVLAYRSLRGLIATRRIGNHDHDAHSACGHDHTFTEAQVNRATDPRTVLALILSIGLRPCSGAILVLVFANVAGLLWAGIAAVMAMSIGTALAIALLAFFAVSARRWTASLAASRHRHGHVVGDLVALAGGLAVMVIGLSLIAGSFASRHPLGLG